MKNNRRNFFRMAGLAGVGLMGSRVLPVNAATNAANDHSLSDGTKEQMLNKKNRFNMCNYGAPKLDTVRLGFIGVGNRGPVHTTQTSRIEGVELKAICDLRPEKA